ncbi:MAG: DNA mismatch repair endonuclease MutH [Gammaproteobacteria bacterium]|nr:MAG: DNA mismatch repair endonuclease MutH [Gammaproteobacteria bacterium]
MIPTPKSVLPPLSEHELLNRCQKIAGQTLGQIATEIGWVIPPDLRQHKGWVGILLEAYLGASAGNKAEPDFMEIAVEMKTLPLNAQGMPKESTYVCTVQMLQTGELCWQDSWVKRKLEKVLWVPVEAEPTIPLGERYIGDAWIWQPSMEQEEILQRDWDELMDYIVLGQQESLTAKQGEYLQIRPKAANSQVLVTGISEEGEINKINPKGFYLRTCFTRKILEQSK